MSKKMMPGINPLKLESWNAPEGVLAVPKGEHSSYAKELRALGQALEARHIVALDLVAVADVYAIRAKARISKGGLKPDKLAFKSAMERIWAAVKGNYQPRLELQTIDFRYSVEDLAQLDRLGRSRRANPAGTPNPNDLSQILRSAGSYLDFKERSSLIGISVQDRWVTIRYQTADGQLQEVQQDSEYLYDYWVKMYLRRSNRPAISTPTDPAVFAIWEQIKKLYELPARY